MRQMKAALRCHTLLVGLVLVRCYWVEQGLGIDLLDNKRTTLIAQVSEGIFESA